MAKCEACMGRGGWYSPDNGQFVSHNECNGTGVAPDSADTPAVVGVDPAEPSRAVFGLPGVSYHYGPAAMPPPNNPEPMRPDPVIAEVADRLGGVPADWDRPANPSAEIKADLGPALRAFEAASAPRQERRLAVLWVNEHTVIDICVREGLNNPQVVVRGEWPGLPADVQVHEVRHEWSRKQFGFVLSSASFPPVPEWTALPDLPERLHMKYRYVEIGTSPMAYHPDAVKTPMPPFRGRATGWSVSAGGRHLATFAEECLADDYLRFIRGRGR